MRVDAPDRRAWPPACHRRHWRCRPSESAPSHRRDCLPRPATLPLNNRLDSPGRVEGTRDLFLSPSGPSRFLFCMPSGEPWGLPRRRAGSSLPPLITVLVNSLFMILLRVGSRSSLPRNGPPETRSPNACDRAALAKDRLRRASSARVDNRRPSPSRHGNVLRGGAAGIARSRLRARRDGVSAISIRDRPGFAWFQVVQSGVHRRLMWHRDPRVWRGSA